MVLLEKFRQLDMCPNAVPCSLWKRLEDVTHHELLRVVHRQKSQKKFSGLSMC